MSDKRKPDGYAYRYADNCIRFSGGQTINGGYPIETIPYYFGPSVDDLVNEARAGALLAVAGHRPYKFEKGKLFCKCGAVLKEPDSTLSEEEAHHQHVLSLTTEASQRAIETGPLLLRYCSVCNQRRYYNCEMCFQRAVDLQVAEARLGGSGMVE